MEDLKWASLIKVAGDLQAEIFGGLLEAQGIPVLLSREGAGKAYGLAVGPLGEVEILVPSNLLESAQKVMADYEAGLFEQPEDDSHWESDEEPDEALE
jgi:Putative prokaryotic signal transducing protein